MKKLFLTSAISVFAVIPAFADNEISDADGLLNGKMCEIDTLGVSSDNAYASLEAIWIARECSAGEYLDTNTCVSCASLGDGSYTLSDAGTTNPEYCYKNVTTTCANGHPYMYGHGTAVYQTSSIQCKEYYGAQNNNCLVAATECPFTLTCDTGYRSIGANGVLANYEYETPAFAWSKGTKCRKADYQGSDTYSGSCTAENVPSEFSDLSDYEWRIDWFDGTTIHGVSSCQAWTGISVYISDNMEQLKRTDMTSEAFFSGLTAAGATAEQYAFVKNLYDKLIANEITEHVFNKLLFEEFYFDTSANYTAGGDGSNCLCKMTGYSINCGTNVTTSNSWMYIYPYSDNTACKNYCANFCATADKTVFRNNPNRPGTYEGTIGAMMQGLGNNMKCTPNTINLNWYTDTVANNGELMTVQTAAQQCTYDGAITLPDTQPTKEGYIFGGWRLRTNNEQ